MVRPPGQRIVIGGLVDHPIHLLFETPHPAIEVPFPAVHVLIRPVGFASVPFRLSPHLRPFPGSTRPELARPDLYEAERLPDDGPIRHAVRRPAVGGRLAAHRENQQKGTQHRVPPPGRMD